MNLQTEQEREKVVEVLEETWDVLRKLDDADAPVLTAEDRQNPSSPYGHLSEALNAMIRELGADPDSIRASLSEPFSEMGWVPGQCHTVCRVIGARLCEVP